jgi:Fe-S-cluster containining protein
MAFDSPDDPPTPPSFTCASCRACCCRLEVLLMPEDAIPERLTTQDHWGAWVMRQLDDGWCIALDRETMLCTIYERRPTVCRDYAVGSYDCIEQRTKNGVGSA